MVSSPVLRTSLALCALSTLAAAQTRYVGNLSGANVVPPVVSPGLGAIHARLDPATSTLTVNVATSGLGGIDTGAQLSNAPAGVNGAAVFALAGGPGTYSGSGVLSALQVAELAAGNLYVEVFSSVNPAGELRTQLVLPAIVINEFSYDDASTDDVEFVEIVNRSTAPVDISGWRLEAIDATTTNPAYTVPAATVLAAGDFYVFGSSLLNTNFTGLIDQVVGTINLWENDNETLTIKDGFGLVQDSLVYEANKGIPVVMAPFVEGEGAWGNYENTETGTPTSVARLRDGFDTDDNRDFHVARWTPGTSNAQGSPKPYCDDFETFAVEATHPRFAGSFVGPRVIDPTAVSVSNPNAIAASPIGGKALITWDPTGGGNGCLLVSTVHGPDILLEMWMYIDTTLEATATEREQWSVGIQGTTCGFHNFGDPSGSLAAGFNTNGNTGIAWMYEVTSTSAIAYLIDHNNGAWPTTATSAPTVLGSVNLTGQPAGWRRLRVQIAGSAVNGWLGGDFGSTATGTQISGTAAAPYAGPAGVYIGYRELVVTNSTTRPPTIDGFFVGHPANAEAFGISAPTTSGLPQLCANSPAELGNAAHAIELRNVTAPGLPAALFLDFFALPVPFDLSTIGAQPNAFLYVPPGVSLTFGTSGTGLDSLAAPIPFDPLILGVDLFWQGVVIDPSLAFSLPVATSGGFRERIH